MTNPFKVLIENSFTVLKRLTNANAVATCKGDVRTVILVVIFSLFEAYYRT